MKVTILTLAAVVCAACSSSDEANGPPPGGAGSGARAGNSSVIAGSGGHAGVTAGKGGEHAGGGASAGRPSASGAGGTPGGGRNTSGGATSGGTTNGGTTNGGTTSGAGREAEGGEGAASGQPSTGGSDCAHDGDHTTTLVFVNRCAGAVTFVGSDIEGKTLSPGDAACVDIGSDTEALSAKRYWGFAGDDPGAEHHSLAEFTFNTDFNDFDWYNISYVDAFNLPLQIVPRERADCDTLTCAADFLAGCPDEGEYRDAGGELVACVSPARNDGDSPVAQYFEACDDAYAWSGDDQHGDDPSPVRACAAEDFDIVFCPEAAP